MENKHKDRNYIVNLILTSFTGEANEHQKEELDCWLKADKRNQALYERLQDKHYIGEQLQEYRKYDSSERWKRTHSFTKKKQSIYKKLFPYAAATAVLILGISFLWQRNLESKEELPVNISEKQITQGDSKASLTLEDGTVISLSKDGDCLLRTAEGENFENDGQSLLYKQNDNLPQKAKWHILSIPRRGGEYVLILADGTKVTLNADSRIRYPDHFTENERRVELYGEAYFEVAKDNTKPFIVSTDTMNIRVLGTSFNVKAYPEERQQATLVEGNVQITCGNLLKNIKAGEQVTIKDNKLLVKNVNVHLYTAWIKQRFVFEDEHLEDVLRKLERWYDIKVIIKDASVKNIRFTGNLPKYENLDKVLKMLELTTNIKFNIEKNILFVSRE